MSPSIFNETEVFMNRSTKFPALVLAAVLLTGCAGNHPLPSAAPAGTEPPSTAGIPQVENQRQNYGGYAVELKSTVYESNSVYATLALTAPEGTDLSSAVDLASDNQLFLQRLWAQPSHSENPAKLVYKPLDDGDGKDNTLDILLQIDPVITQGAPSAYGPGKTCALTFDAIVLSGYDRAYEQELLATKYAGVTDYMLDSEEAARVHPKTVLASGAWRFEIALEASDDGMIELLSAPVTIKALVMRPGPGEYDVDEVIEDVTLTAIQLRPRSITVAFEAPAGEYNSLFLNAAHYINLPGLEIREEDSFFVVMRDGRTISTFQRHGAKDTALLDIDIPVDLDEVEALLLPGGAKLLIATSP